MRKRALWIMAVVLGVCATDAQARPKKDKEPTTAANPTTVEAREEFNKGTEAVKLLQWNEALVHFEKANNLKPSPVVVFNIAMCERATGHYVRAIDKFEAAARGPEGLPAAQVEEAKTYANQLRAELAHVKMKIEPADARLAVDGRPLMPWEPGNDRVLVAGLDKPGEGKKPPHAEFEMVVDPGNRVITASFEGHEDVLISKDFPPKARVEMEVNLREMPSSVKVECDQPRCVVVLDGMDVGMAPKTIERPAGSYRLRVLKKGFVAYETTLQLPAGQHLKVRAQLTPETESITQKWWFWGGAAAIVAGGVTAAYLLTRPGAQPQPYDRGTLDWLAQPR